MQSISKKTLKVGFEEREISSFERRYSTLSILFRRTIPSGSV